MGDGQGCLCAGDGLSEKEEGAVGVEDRTGSSCLVGRMLWRGEWAGSGGRWGRHSGFPVDPFTQLTQGAALGANPWVLSAQHRKAQV